MKVFDDMNLKKDSHTFINKLKIKEQIFDVQQRTK